MNLKHKWDEVTNNCITPVIGCMRIADLSHRYYVDDVETICAVCGETILHRPHVEDYPKVCIPCIQEYTPSDTTFTASKQTLKEIFDYLEAKEEAKKAEKH